MMPPPPRSTLFPYTTLFRSLKKKLKKKRLRKRRKKSLKKRRNLILLKKNWKIWKSIKDRKSTRLNSSHPSISYAVFCLKKTVYYKKDGLLVICDTLAHCSRY